MELKLQAFETYSLLCYPPYARFRWKLKILLYRIIMRILDSVFVTGYSVTSENVKNNLVQWGTKREIAINPLPIIEVEIKKVKHNSFNILYYMPTSYKSLKFAKWQYGYDIMLIAKRELSKKNIKWMIIDGTSEMTNIYPITDFVVRCNRWDGNSRMIREAIKYQIPYYYSQEKPNSNALIKAIVTVLSKNQKEK